MRLSYASRLFCNAGLSIEIIIEGFAEYVQGRKGKESPENKNLTDFTISFHPFQIMKKHENYPSSPPPNKRKNPKEIIFDSVFSKEFLSLQVVARGGGVVPWNE